MTSSVPPGVSYAPRDLIPTRRFSTSSMRPTPLAAAISFNCSISASGASFLPFTETGVPASKPISTVVERSGAFAGDTIHCHMDSSGAFAGSSSTPPSWLKCQMLRSRL